MIFVTNAEWQIVVVDNKKQQTSAPSITAPRCMAGMAGLREILVLRAWFCDTFGARDEHVS